MNSGAAAAEEEHQAVNGWAHGLTERQTGGQQSIH